MLELVARCLVAVVLLSSGVTKTLAGGDGRRQVEAALARGPFHRFQHASAWLPAVEIALAALLLIGAFRRTLLICTAALFAGFTVFLVGELRGGRAGEPCLCFGANQRSVISRRRAASTALTSIFLATLATIPTAASYMSVPLWQTAWQSLEPAQYALTLAVTVSAIAFASILLSLLQIRRLRRVELNALGLDAPTYRTIVRHRRSTRGAVLRTPLCGSRGRSAAVRSRRRSQQPPLRTTLRTSTWTGCSDK